ncbi:MAG: hypothetical protein WC609_00650 [Candidatus Paceibacterota bacterium]|jgi:hypothetical protein
MKYGELNLGQIEAVVNKLGGMEGVNRFLRDELMVSEPAHRFRVENGVIYLSVTSDGTTGPEWTKRLEKKGYRLGDYAKQILCSKDFKPTKDVTTKIAILKGTLFSDEDRITEKIRTEAAKRNLTKPNAEVACLIRENFSDEELEAMGLIWVVIMHEPIKDSDGDPRLLDAGRDVEGGWLDANYDYPVSRWARDDGFAFVSQA